MPKESEVKEANKRSKEQQEQAIGDMEIQRRNEERVKLAASLQKEPGKDNEPEKSSNEIQFKPVVINKKNSQDWDKIIDDYIKEFNIKDYKKGGPLIFPSMEAAINFMESQAKQGREFLASEVTQNGEKTGFHLFSCGTGDLYKGSLDEIKSALEKSLENEPDNGKVEKIKAGIEKITAKMDATPTQNARKALQEMRQSKPEAPKLAAPRPLSTTPKPS